jgi:poly(3-hydroxybutyrate) depolymerase
MLRSVVLVLTCAISIDAAEQITRETLSVAGTSREYVLYVPGGPGTKLHGRL